MKKRYWIAFLICILVCVAVALFFTGKKPRLLSELYPAVARGEYNGTIVWDEMTGENGIGQLSISDKEFQRVLGNASVRKHKKEKQMPSVAFDLHMTYQHKGYAIIVGKDHTRSVALMDDLDGSRTFWTDLDEQVFEDLYQCYRNSGGPEIPEIEAYP